MDGATTADAAALAGLATQLGYSSTTAQVHERMDAVLAEGDHAVLVARLDDGAVLGWVHVFAARRVESDAFAELGGFVVDERHRSRGIGRSLLDAAEGWAAERGLAKLRVRTRSGRADARAFYERLGFALTKEQHVYDKDVGPGAPEGAGHPRGHAAG